jgi:hypothetical protein
MGVFVTMQLIIENFMEVEKKGRRRELTFREHGHIISALESQDPFAYAFFAPNYLIWSRGWNSSIKIYQMMK